MEVAETKREERGRLATVPAIVAVTVVVRLQLAVAAGVILSAELAVAVAAAAVACGFYCRCSAVIRGMSNCI